MNDLISRSALLQEFETETNNHRGNDLWHIAGIKAMIENAPTIEVVPVVHCKDCSHWGRNIVGETGRVKCCDYGGYMVGENGYCVYGER